jgi:hypothetical protein
VAPPGSAGKPTADPRFANRHVATHRVQRGRRRRASPRGYEWHALPADTTTAMEPSLAIVPRSIHA